MIIYAKKDEIDGIISKLENIEEHFWLEYRNRSKSNREYLEVCFEDLYNKIDDLINGRQFTMPENLIYPEEKKND